MEFCTDGDIERWPAGFSGYKCIISVGHDEYYSAIERVALEKFSASGGRLAFFSGNLATWQTRFADATEANKAASSTDDGSRELEGYNFAASGGDGLEGDYMICYKQYLHRQSTTDKSDPLRITGFTQHPLVGTCPINALTMLGAAQGGYHRSHGQIMDGSGAFTLKMAGTWITAGLGTTLTVFARM
eukprot:SAG31_NODE_2705_length_5215_cov_9.452502_5_plen_187_part_00